MSRASSVWMQQPTQRFFSTAAMASTVPMLRTEYLMQMARVKLHLPKEGECWFFIKPEDTVATFIESVKNEDDEISKLEVLEEAGKSMKPVKDSAPLYSLIRDSQTPLFLSLNGMEFRFN